MLARWRIIDQNFVKQVRLGTLPTPQRLYDGQEAELSRDKLIDLFDSQLMSRHLDLQARILKASGHGYYTIGSSGHEGNVVLGEVFRHTDYAFLHYRSCALFLQRAKKVPTINAIRDIVLSLMAAAEEPVCSGRHKVFGSVPLCVPPQTSTIASHLPKAVGFAWSIHRASVLGIKNRVPDDAVVLCNFGDASFNHATAQGALNTCRWLVHQRHRVPIIFVCEDNGIGVSVPTPADWIARRMRHDPDIDYIQANGLSIVEAYAAAKHAEQIARTRHRPVFLHLKVVRLMGHAGSDIEHHYWQESDIVANEAQDPLLHSAGLMLARDIMSVEQIIARYESIRKTIHEQAEALKGCVALPDKRALTQSLYLSACNHPLPSAELTTCQHDEPHGGAQRKSLAQALNAVFAETLKQYPTTLFFGEDVGKKGGVYRITADLQKQFGVKRVFDTLLDETTILGTAIGLSMNGFISIPEIQFLAFVHNAVDQIRGEAATLSFFSNAQYQNPMVIRIPGLAYQRGFGGHFHNDNAIAFLREIPGVIILCPSRADRAVLLWRRAMRLAYHQQRVVIFIEPIALYHQKDCYMTGDQKWLFEYPSIDQIAAENRVTVEQAEAKDLAILSYGNGYRLSVVAAQAIKQTHNCSVRLIDLQWLAPLPEKSLLDALTDIKRLIIVDECRQTGAISEQIVTYLVEKQHAAAIKRVVAADCFIPLGTTWQYLLPDEQAIIDAANQLFQSCGQSPEGVHCG